MGLANADVRLYLLTLCDCTTYKEQVLLVNVEH